MTKAPQGASFGRAPPSLRWPPGFTAIHLPSRTYRNFWTLLDRVEIPEEDWLAYHRLRAILTYGTEDENPAEVALLSEEEKERLEPIAILERWHRFRVSQGRNASAYGERSNS